MDWCCSVPLTLLGGRTKPPKSIGSADGAGAIMGCVCHRHLCSPLRQTPVPTSARAFQHCWSPGLGHGGLFPTRGEVFLLSEKCRPRGKGYSGCEAAEDVANNRDIDEHGKLALPSQSVCSGDVIAALLFNAWKRCLLHLFCWG